MSNNNSSINIGSNVTFFCMLLTILFIGLKLTGHIVWSWIWVLSPIWIPFAIVIGLFLLCFVGVKIIQFFKWIGKSGYV